MDTELEWRQPPSVFVLDTHGNCAWARSTSILTASRSAGVPDVYDSALRGTRKGMRKRGGLVRRRVGLIVGFGAGYYFGSKAGRLRYEQIQRWLAEARQSGPVEKVQAAVEARLERMRQQTEALTGTAVAPDASS